MCDCSEDQQRTGGKWGLASLHICNDVEVVFQERTGRKHFAGTYDKVFLGHVHGGSAKDSQVSRALRCLP